MLSANLPASTRIWVYQSDRAFSTAESNMIRAKAQAFVENWVSHSRDLQGNANLLHNRFLVLMVDENSADASGCSIDSSVSFVRSLEKTYENDFFNRMLFTFRDQNGEVQTVDSQSFKALYANGEINDETIVFDPLVKNKGELETVFEKPLAQSWHKRFV